MTDCIPNKSYITAARAFDFPIYIIHGSLFFLSKETGLSHSIEYYYKFLVLLPLEADEKIETLKHYYGITQEGELVVRGIEIRRHDILNFIKQFQTELLYTLFDCKDSAEVAKKGMKMLFSW